MQLDVPALWPNCENEDRAEHAKQSEENGDDSHDRPRRKGNRPHFRATAPLKKLGIVDMANSGVHAWQVQNAELHSHQTVA
jgi:hypothetical protein